MLRRRAASAALRTSANSEQLSIEGATGKRDEDEKERGNDVDMREREEERERVREKRFGFPQKTARRRNPRACTRCTKTLTPRNALEANGE